LVTYKHTGERPTYKIADFFKTEFGQIIHIEEFPDGSKRWWTNKQLKSGCNTVLKNPKRQDDLIYCKKCDEWFNKKQFKERRDEK